MTGDLKLVRTLDDLVRTVSSIAIHFKTDQVFIIGSQSILLSWPDAPIILRTSREIDAYPGNARIWEIAEKSRDPTFDAEASEEIAALFGEGSAFHVQFGFYIDGVDENTSRLPDGCAIVPSSRSSHCRTEMSWRSRPAPKTSSFRNWPG